MMIYSDIDDGLDQANHEYQADQGYQKEYWQ